MRDRKIKPKLIRRLNHPQVRSKISGLCSYTAGNIKSRRSPIERTAELIAAGRIEIDFETVRVPGCRVPIWRLEMARRAGSPADSLIKVLPGLTPEGLVQAFAFARRHRDEIDRLIREKGPIEPPPGVEPDDDVDFEKELVDLIDRDAEAYERLAR